MKLKICPGCKIKKPIIKFHKCSTRKDGLQSCCKECTSIRQKQYYQQNRKEKLDYACNYSKTHKNQKRNRELKLKYNITLDEYDKMFEQQNGVCAICGQPETSINKWGNAKRLFVDHNHKTGRVRKLLCSGCNARLGVLEDADWVSKGFRYLKETR